MMKNIGRKSVIAATGISLIIILLFLIFRSKNGEILYKTEKINRGDIIESISATGTVNAITTVQVGTQVSGTVQKLYVDFNSRVKKGQVIALIDPTNFIAQLEQAKANLSAAKANLDKSIVLQADTKRTMERNKELLRRNLIAQADLDTAETNYHSAKAQVDASAAQIEQAKAALKIAQTNLAYTRITSPVSGIVISRNVDVGQTVAASFQTPTLFTIAEDLTKMQIDTNVNEADIGKVRTGMNVTFNVDAYPDTPFKGVVSQVRNAPITVQNVVTYDVVIKVDNSDLKLKPGMTANASIITAKKSGVLKIPNASLRFKMQEKTDAVSTGKGDLKGPAVWIIEKNKPRRVSVSLGITDGSYTEVVSGQLSGGEEIILEKIVKTQKSGDTGTRPPRMF